MVDFENVIDIVTTGRPIEKENTHCDCHGSRTNVTIVWSMRCWIIIIAYIDNMSIYYKNSHFRRNLSYPVDITIC